MEMDPTIVALRHFEEAEMAFTAFAGNLLESGVTIPPELRAQAKALRVALDTEIAQELWTRSKRLVACWPTLTRSGSG